VTTIRLAADLRPASIPALSLRGLLLASLLASCDGGAGGGGGTTPPDLAPHDRRDAPSQRDAKEGATEAGRADGLPSCPSAPCAAYPIICVHGFRGGSDDFTSLLEALSSQDPRYSGYNLAGITDHKKWAAGSVPRRKWLFAFDYYLDLGTDKRETYSAGAGRIGSNPKNVCTSPSGKGHLIADATSYDTGYRHEYAQDLADFVDSVLRATGAKQVDFVAHSMGGIVVRSYLSYYGGAKVARRVLFLASPTKGIKAVAWLETINIGQPTWMSTHEVAELDAGSVLSKIHFTRCGDTSLEQVGFGTGLLADEELSPPSTEYYVLWGGSDVTVSQTEAHNPLALTEEKVPAVSHSGILSAQATLQKAMSLLGGKAP
jgi:pimeloyl-ACP methyl ester carboxylesterase